MQPLPCSLLSPKENVVHFVSISFFVIYHLAIYDSHGIDGPLDDLSLNTSIDSGSSMATLNNQSVSVFLTGFEIEYQTPEVGACEC